MDWWSSGAKDRDTAFNHLVASANRATLNGAEAEAEAVGEMGRERQRQNVIKPASVVKEEAEIKAAQPPLAEMVAYLTESTTKWKAEVAAREAELEAQGLDPLPTAAFATELEKRVQEVLARADEEDMADPVKRAERERLTAEAAARNSVHREEVERGPLVVGGSVPSSVAAAQRTALTAGVGALKSAEMRGLAAAQCCLMVDHVRSQKCSPCRRYYAVPWLHTQTADGIKGQTTFRLMLDLIEKRAANVYTIYGDTLAPMVLPPHLFDEPQPAGANLGGVWPALRNLTTTAGFDSYLLRPRHTPPKSINLSLRFGYVL